MFFIFLVLLVVALFLLVGYRVWLMELETRKRVLLRKSSDTALCNPYLALSATQMSKLLRQGKITSVDLVSASIKQAKRVSHLNALVCDRFDDALRDAALADERLMKYEAPEKLPPFLGVPCSIKEAFSVQGMPNSGGLYSRRNLIAKKDAPTVAALKMAGFIVIGVSNTSELCMWQESSNTIYGRTSSSHCAERTSGGSSGGEGALVGSQVVPVGLGSDIGGSIRMPSFFNGVFGFKPTAGLVSNEGQFPVTERGGEADMFLCTGPIVKKSEDLWPLLNILSSPKVPKGNPSDVDFSRLRVFSIEQIGMWYFLAPSDELVQCQRDALKCLKDKSKVLEAKTIPPFSKMRSSLEIWSTLLQAAETESFADKLYGKGQGGVLKSLFELAKWLFGASKHTIPAIGLALLEILTKSLTTKSRIALLKKDADELRKEIEDMLGDNGVLLFPSFPTTAPLHSRAILFPVQWIYTAIFNTLQLPVVQVPLGLSKDHIPLGIQVIARRDHDFLACAVACELERQGYGHVHPVK